MDSEPKTYRKTGANPANQRFAAIVAAGDSDKGIKPNNATAAYREVFGGNPNSARELARQKMTNLDVQADIAQQRERIAQESGKAITRLAQLRDQKRAPGVALGASTFLIDQAHGKATQRVESVGVTANITMDLSGGTAGDIPQAILDKLSTTPKDTD